MVEDNGKEDEPKLEFDSGGQAIAYISLDQARVLALRHARDNREPVLSPPVLTVLRSLARFDKGGFSGNCR